MKYIKQSATNQSATSNFNFFDENDDHLHLNGTQHEHWDYGTNQSYVNNNETEQMQQTKKDQWKMLRNFNPPSSTTDVHIPTDGFFCESPSPEYGHFVLERVNQTLNESLFEWSALIAMCDLEMRLTQVNYYRDLCQVEIGSKKCCRPWSLPNYVALLSNRSSCLDIEVSRDVNMLSRLHMNIMNGLAQMFADYFQEEDLADVQQLLLDCNEYYHSFKLSNDCVNKKCQVPVECQQHNAVYNIIHFLTDSDFIKVNTVEASYFSKKKLPIRMR